MGGSALKSRAKRIRRSLERYVSKVEDLGVDSGQLGKNEPKLFIATQGDHVRGKFQGLRPALVEGDRASRAVNLLDLDLDDEEDQEKALNALREAKKEFKYS